MLLRIVEFGKVDPTKLMTHHFKLTEIHRASEVFGNPVKEKLMKVIIESSSNS